MEETINYILCNSLGLGIFIYFLFIGVAHACVSVSRTLWIFNRYLLDEKKYPNNKADT